MDRGGKLLAGTTGTGLVYRIDTASGAAAVLYDALQPEVADLAVDETGAIFAAVVSAGAGEVPPPAVRITVHPAEEETPVPVAPEEITPGKPAEPGRAKAQGPLEAEMEGLSPAGAQPPRAGQGGGAIIKLASDGSIEELWKSSEEIPFAVTAAPGGAVYVGTGEPARLLRIEEAGRVSLVARFPQAQICRILSDPAGDLFAATSNSGSAYRITRELSESGTYESPVRDAGAGARWGKIRWESDLAPGQKLEIQTRVGNSLAPDETWSPWSAFYASPEGSDIASPSARYIQWRTRLVRPPHTPSSPVLRTVSLSYLPANRRPRVSDVSVLTAEESRSADLALEVMGATDTMGDATPAAAASPPRAGAAPGKDGRRMRTVVWHVEDPDSDLVSCRLLFQKEGDDRWSEMAFGVTESSFSFDETTRPEGRYRVKVVGSDAPSNVAGEALSSEAVSEIVIIDHTPPTLEMQKGPGPRGGLLVLVSDALSPIVSAEILSADKVVMGARPVDGVLDSPSETIEIVATADLPASGLRLRVRDAAGNEATLDLPTMVGGRR